MESERTDACGRILTDLAGIFFSARRYRVFGHNRDVVRYIGIVARAMNPRQMQSYKIYYPELALFDIISIC